MTELKIDLEKYKKKIEELDSNNRDLSLQWSRLSLELREKESSFQVKVCELLCRLTCITIFISDVSQGIWNGLPGQADSRIQENVWRDKEQACLWGNWGEDLQQTYHTRDEQD